MSQPKKKKKKIKVAQQKYIDDMTQSVAIDLKKTAKIDPNPTPVLPRQFHQRTGHILPIESNPLQDQFYSLKKYADEKGMKINFKKTKLMIFNSAKKIDILPEVKISDDELIEVVDEMKLLGLLLRSDLSWISNTNSLVSKGYKRLWMLRNLKKYGASEEHLVDVFIKQVRSILELNCPVWHPGITKKESRLIERVQRTAIAIIRRDKFTSYSESLKQLNLETLEVRRKKLCLRFAVKASKHPKFSKWFMKDNSTVKTRSTKLPLKEIKSRTKRFRKSPLPYLTSVLNQYLNL